MKVSIRLYYRIVKAIRDGKTYYVPQYQDEDHREGIYQNFSTYSGGRVGHRKDIVFSTYEEAREFIKKDKVSQDEVMWVFEA
jgi:hypothetical protein